jgi:bacteriocin-like protein
MTITRAQIPQQVAKPPMKKKMAAGKPKDLSKLSKKMLKEIKGGR